MCGDQGSLSSGGQRWGRARHSPGLPVGVLRRTTLTIYVIPGDRKLQWPKTATCLAQLTSNLGAHMALKGTWLAEDSSYTPVPLLLRELSPMGSSSLWAVSPGEFQEQYKGHHILPKAILCTLPSGLPQLLLGGQPFPTVPSQLGESEPPGCPHPCTQRFFSRSSFPLKLELLLLQPPDL